MTVSFSLVGAADAHTSVSNTTLSLGIPANIAEDDLMVAIVSIHKLYTTTVSATNWTVLRSVSNESVHVLYKFAGASEADNSPYTFTMSRDYGYARGVIVRATGVDAGTAPTIQGPTETAAYNTTVDLPSITVNTSGNGVIYAGSRDKQGGSDVSSCSRGSAVDRYSEAGTSTSCPLWVFSEDNVTSAVSGATFTLAADSDDKYAVAIDVEMAASASPQILSISSQNYALAFTK